MNDTLHIDKIRWRSLVLQIIIGTASSFVYVLSVFIGPLMTLKGWDANAILFTFTLAMWVGSPSLIIGGKISQIFGVKKTMCVSGFLYGVAIIVSAFVTSVTVFMILQGIVASFFMFVISVCSLNNIGTLYPDKRGWAEGLVLAGQGIGGALIAPLAQTITDHFSVIVSIAGQGIFYAVIMVICSAFIVVAPEGYKPAGWKGEHLDIDAAEKAPDHSMGPDVNWLGMLKTPVFWMIFVCLLLINIVGTMPISNGAYMTEITMGASPMVSAWVMTATTIGCAIGNWGGGWLTDKIGAMKTLGVIGASNAVFAFLIATVGLNNLAVWIIALVIISIDYGALTTIMPVIAMNTYGPKNFGVNYGLLGCNAIVVTAIGPQLTLMENLSMGFIICGVLALAGSIISFIGVKLVSKYIKKAWTKQGE